MMWHPPTRLNGRASQSKVSSKVSEYDIYLRCIGSCSAQKALFSLVVKNVFKGFWISHVGIIVMKGIRVPPTGDLMKLGINIHCPNKIERTNRYTQKIVFVRRIRNKVIA